MKKFLLSLFLLMAAAPAFAFVSSYRVVNHSDYQVRCAFAQIAVANPQSPEVTVYHWYVINNGQSYTFNGRVDGLYCEDNNGSNTRWAGNAGYLCVSRAQYVNPFYKANRADDCNNFGGEMVAFRDVQGFGAQSVTLNAPN